MEQEKRNYSILDVYCPDRDEMYGIDRFDIYPIEGAEDYDDVELHRVESNANAHIKVSVKAPRVDNEFLAEFFQQLADTYSANALTSRLVLDRKEDKPQ